MKKYFLIMALLSGSVFAFNISDAEKEIRLMVRDSSIDTDNQHWTPTELYRRIELAQNDIIRKSGCLETQGSLTMVSGQGDYTLASDCLEVRRVEYSTTTTYPLIFLSKRKLDTMEKTWKGDTGKPSNWTDIIFSSNVITIYPAPSAGYAGNKITYDYIAKVDGYATYTGTTAIFGGRPSLQPYYSLIMFHVARSCMIDNMDWGSAGSFKTLYDEGLQQLIIELNSATIERTLRRPAAVVK